MTLKPRYHCIFVSVGRARREDSKYHTITDEDKQHLEYREKMNLYREGKHHVSQHVILYYRPQMKLREGNVFTPVCQFFCTAPPGSDSPWSHPLHTPTVNKRAVHILLECFLVCARIMNYVNLSS